MELEEITFNDLLNYIKPWVETTKFDLLIYQLCNSILGISNQIVTNSTTKNNNKAYNTSFSSRYIVFLCKSNFHFIQKFDL